MKTYAFLRFLPLTLTLIGLIQAQSDSLVVHTTSGIFRGVESGNGTERWLGIRFANPPVGLLRFKAPVPFNGENDSSVKTATTFGNACPQPPGDVGAPISEDCLFINVWRPQDTTANAKLPVLVWIYGGQYTTGSSVATFRPFPAFELLLHAVAVPLLILYMILPVSSHAACTLGNQYFLCHSPQDLDAGLLDQRLAMEWVQDNIIGFGGDPDKVTIWGQSAGAGSTEAHMIYPANRTLFRAVMGDSAVGPFKSSPPASTYDKPGLPFARLLDNTGCTFGPDAIKCLQNIPFDTLLNISNAMTDATLNMQLWQPAIGPPGSFAETRASIKIQNKDFLHVPYLAGTNFNEGTTFSTSVLGLNLTGRAQDDAFVNFIGHLFIDNSTITQDLYDDILHMWPANDPSLGGPFHTGDSLFDRASAWYGDEMFIAPRRLFFENAAGLQNVFPYWFKEFIPGNNVTLGVSHASELPLLFGPVPTPVEDEFADQMLDFYINFINDMDPGAPWPRYTDQSKQVLQLLRGNITAVPDDFDLDKTNFLLMEKVLAEFQK
ncbi:hypothetical protein GYMLUDRAFT_63723 [Collybiopsis luxurians FD-317 M1]|uniref:Carboxylic ester hydrolase n=1 Tax=Collybiopsis luxurians FD-317 M1 TaxID=944289 RepID=A0A0D0CEB3_9AGAR|nr:hypothetical protein GYMLUDRAFT_63723 [Collybiopsis luxurians FD-317 M1]